VLIKADTSYRSLAAMFSVSTVLYNAKLNESKSFLNGSRIATMYGSQLGLERQTSISIAKGYIEEMTKHASKIN